MSKKKYWLALGEHSLFTKEDNRMFQVYPWGQTGSAGVPLHSCFVEADALEDARAQLHAFVDKRIDHEKHMLKIDGIVVAKGKVRENMRQAQLIPDSDVNELSIGGLVNQDWSNTEGLLNLEDLI